MPASRSILFGAPVALGIAVLLFLSSRCGYFDDPRLYFETSGLAFGRPVHAGYLPIWRDGDRTAETPIKTFAPQAPYRDFVFEYPPLVMLVFAAPRLLADSVLWFYRFYQLEMSAMLVALLWCALRIAPRMGERRPSATVIAWSWLVLVIALGPTLLRRYDAAPALAVGAAIVLMLDRKIFAAALVLGIGTALKLWPALLTPILVMPSLQRRDLQRAARIVTVSLIVPIASHAILMPWIGLHVFDYFRYHTARGLQLETLGANSIVLWHWLTHQSTQIVLAFGAQDVVLNGGERHVPMILSGLLLLAYAVTLGWIWKKLRDSAEADPAGENDSTLVAGSLLIICVLLLFAKILSLQYLAWMLPLIFVLPGNGGWRSRGSYIGAIALSIVAFKLLPHLVGPKLWVHALILLPRNLLLIEITIEAALATARNQFGVRLPSHADDALDLVHGGHAVSDQPIAAVQ